MRACVRWLDRALRQYQGIVEFCDQAPCVLRVSPARAGLALILPDGTRISPGDPLLELHLWNERLPRADTVSTLGRGGSLRSRLDWSLEALARYLSEESGPDEVCACHALFRFHLGSRRPGFVRVMRQLGFTVANDLPSSPARLAAEHGYVRALQWTYHPVGPYPDIRPFEQVHLWMSRRMLLARYRQPSILSLAGRPRPPASACALLQQHEQHRHEDQHIDG
ncbi:MAG TPA: hypothetical protein VIC33_13475 [Vicinamibacterales bacterium]|jgi:hypothetical protein